ncbi:hypothetical protein AB0K05_24965 [Nonomuraea sp. NPDC049486]|uniref:phage distal tail protein n=1 Tax=Nonomuraea sp. NPDC049486 TaxID=3155773 RepID=UPI00343D0D82
MVAAYRSHTTATNDASGTYTINRPPGTTEGDILVLAHATDSGAVTTLTAPSGFSVELSQASAQTYTRGRVFLKAAGASEPATYTLTKTASDAAAAILICISGAELPAVSAASSSGSGSNVSTPSVTPSTASGIEVRFAAGDGNETGRTFTAPATYTEPSGADINIGGYTHLTAAYKVLSSAAATGALNFTASGTMVSYVGFTIFLPSAGEDAEATPGTVAAVAAVPDPVVGIGAEPIPATVAATAALPGPDVSAGSTATPATVAVEAAVPAPSVTTQDVELVVPATIEAAAGVPDPAVAASADATLNTIEAVAALYGPDVSSSASVTLATVAVVADVPAPSVTVPVLPGDQISRAGQIEWNGFLLGSLTPYSWQELQGWTDSAPFISGNVDRPDSSGSYPGQPYTAERTINWGMLIKAPRATMGQVVHDLVMATGPAQSEDEGWLVIWDFDDLQPRLVRAHLADRLPGPINQQARLGLMRGALQWIASDPRRYDPVRSSLTIAKDVETSILNNGNDSTPGELRFPGPATGIQVENLTTDRVIAFSTTVADGETLIVDVKEGTVAIGDTNKLNDLVEGSSSVQDFVFDPGPNTLFYTADTGGTAGMETFWRHAVS